MSITTQYPNNGLTLSTDECGFTTVSLIDEGRECILVPVHLIGAAADQGMFTLRDMAHLTALDYDAINVICDIEDDLTTDGVFGGEENDCIPALDDQIFFTRRHTPLLPQIDYSNDDLADLALLRAYGF